VLYVLCGDLAHKMRISTVALDYAPDHTSTEGVSEWLMKG